MVTRHTYASADDLRDYLAGTTYSSGWTSDASVLRRILETASERINNYVGMQSLDLKAKALPLPVEGEEPFILWKLKK